MATNYIQDGCTLQVTNGTGSTIASGSPVFVGNVRGVAIGSIADSESGPIATEGVFSFPKKASLAISAGDVVFWDATPGEVTKTAADGKYLGVAIDESGSSDETVNVAIGENPVAAAVADIDTVDGSNAGTTQTLANDTKATVNALLASLRAAGIIAGA